MMFSRLRLAFGATLVLSAAKNAVAVPAVNVDLRAAFEAPPYLVELLETAAQENATSYFPLLDRIADGYFDTVSTDQELYKRFRELLEKDGHLNSAEDLSSFDLALSIHSAAPLVEAHYQFYHTSVRPSMQSVEGETGDAWVYASFTGQAFSSPDLDPSKAKQLGKPGEQVRQLSYDRVLGDKNHEYASILYADILSKSFRDFHKVISKTAKEGKTSYRVRYIPSESANARHLTVSGYGVELALKRTDYLVIDDRQESSEESKAESSTSETTLSEEEISDLRPLSASEVRLLDLKAASFVIANEKPMEMLARLTQDFPKYSSAIAGMNVSKQFLQEHNGNREVAVRPGANLFWINGVQIIPREINAYSLLEHLRRERRMINGVRELGLTGPQAVRLLSHEAITESQVDQDVQRYEWRDDIEGGDVIMWLNNIEKDKRYEDWPDDPYALLQRTFPGQLPSVRSNIYNIVLSIDFSSLEDVTLIVETLQTFVKRNLPIRFGLAPRTHSLLAEQQAKVMYYLLETHGLVAALQYLEVSLISAGRNFGSPQEDSFKQAVEDRKVRQGRTALTMQDALTNENIAGRIESAKAYANRLALTGAKPPLFANGVAIVNDDNWLNEMSQRMGLDLRELQQSVYTGELQDGNDLSEWFLKELSTRRVPLVIPEDDKSLLHLDLSDLPELAELPSLPANIDTIEHELAHMTVIADVDTYAGFEQLMEALLFHREHDNIELAWLHVFGDSAMQLDYTETPDLAFLQHMLGKYDQLVEEGGSSSESTQSDSLDLSKRQSIYRRLFDSSLVARREQAARLPASNEIHSAIGLQRAEAAIILNGRVVGPIPDSVVLGVEELETLFAYERKHRLLPASKAIKSLQLQDKATSPFAFAKISNVIALSQVSEIPEGIYEAASTLRGNFFNQWNSSHTAIKIGDAETAGIQIVASIDPASELAQKWVPILKVLSELDGVATTIFLNPKDYLEELPVKRFYRYVLESQPRFDESGTLSGLGAQFAGLPADALLNLGMELPPSWLVAPKESIHDLDNIKLSAVKSGSDIQATYELEHILIEGHSSDTTTGQPPRGAQLVLGTGNDSHFASTIIMANLGYFQFKANPGVYSLAMQRGRSEEIFQIDAAGSLGRRAQSEDNSTDVALTSFVGSTLFPTISRKAGMEDEDVLEPSKSALENLANNADKLLAQAGIPGGDYLSKAAKFSSNFLAGGGKSTGAVAGVHAEINIFSVASGHLYERMLNIMMLSVMKHTKHTVKFWFIEQFLSPSFKDFLPALAEEYGFQYEMVTYKWPHWLRGQKEKQREIWGYKILFLDVLFPLDLDKVIFVDADQIVRTDMYELVQHDLEGAPYGFTPMCDSRVEMEGFRFWKQGYWKNFLKDLNYHISALYVVDLKRFRQIAAGDRLRGHYHQLSADPGSLSNLDQDLPNHMQSILPIHSLPQDWLWCETWCSDEALRTAKTIDLCNNPQTKEPKLDRARRQVPEWTLYDDEVAAVAKRYRQRTAQGRPIAGDAADAGPQGEEEESIQERLQREDAEKEQKDKSQAEHKRDEL